MGRCWWGATWQTTVSSSSIYLKLLEKGSHKAGKGRQLRSNTGEARNCLSMEGSLQPWQGLAVHNAFREGAVAQFPTPLPCLSLTALQHKDI